ncbi:MAG: cation:proton antiporter [Acidimicrobiia bacterium]|nr:cation:proton antiporter [Acidimicrobiia bacterium]
MSLDLVNLLAVLTAALGAGAIARRLGYPAVLGELAAGIVLGPAVLGLLAKGDALTVIGKLGVLVMMLAIGMHIEPRDLRRASGPGLLAAVGGFVVPAALGIGVALLYDQTLTAAVFIGLAMGVTSLATKSRILVDLDLLGTRIAHVLMAGALIADVAVLIAFSAVLGAAAAGALLFGDLALMGLQVALFLLGAFVVGTRVLPLVGGMISRLDRVSRMLAVVGIGLGFGAAAEAAGVHAILGAFIGGLFLREGVLDRDAFRETENDVGTAALGFLAPVFFVTAGFDVSFAVFRTDLALLVLVVVLATVGKVFGTALFYTLSGRGWREGVTIGAGMNGRGAVEIVVAELALEQGIIGQEVFSILVFMAFFTTATVPVLLTAGVRWLRRRGDLAEAGADRAGVVVAGAGPLARTVAAELAHGRRVTVVDTNPDHVEAARRAGLPAVRGSVLQEADLAEAGGTRAGLYLGLTPNLEVNLLGAQVADRALGIPTRLVAVPAGPTGAGETLLEGSGVTPWLGRPVDLAAWEVAIEHGTMRLVTIEVEDPDDLPLVGRGPADPDLEVLPLVVLTRDTARLFDASATLSPGDHVVVATKPAEDELPSPAGTTEAV